MIARYQGSSKRILRLGLIGLGGIARYSHIPALVALKRAEWQITVAAVADPTPENLAAGTQLLSENNLIKGACSVYTDGEALLASGEVDAALIFAPPSVTPQLIAGAMNRSIPVFAEKPVAVDVPTLEELVRSEKAWPSVYVRIGYNRRSQPLAEQFRANFAALRSAAPAGIIHVEARLWRSERADAIFYEDTMVHALDFLLWLIGPLEVERVEWWPGPDEDNRPAGMRASLRSREPIHPTVTAALDVRPAVGRDLETYEVTGPRETLELRYPAGSPETDPARLIYYRKNESRDVLLPDPVRDSVAIAARGFVGQLAAFLEPLCDPAGVRPGSTLCTLADALQTLTMREKILGLGWPPR